MDTLIATAFAALFAGCWVMEMRSSRKMREAEIKRYNDAMRDRLVAVAQALDAGWLDGVEYQREQMTRKRDKAGRFA
jgi:hypothetical protein